MEKIKIRGRVYVRLTPAQKRRLKRVREQIAQDLPVLIRRNHLADRAMKEKTFSGALRRAIHDFPLSPIKVAEKAGVARIEFEDFLTGEKTLPSDVIDRLVKIVKLKIPVRGVKPRPRRAKAG